MTTDGPPTDAPQAVGDEGAASLNLRPESVQTPTSLASVGDVSADDPFEDFESDLAQATSKVYWAEESSCMEETFGTVQRVVRELEGRVKVLSDLLNERPADTHTDDVYAVLRAFVLACDQVDMSHADAWDQESVEDASEAYMRAKAEALRVIKIEDERRRVGSAVRDEGGDNADRS